MTESSDNLGKRPLGEWKGYAFDELRYRRALNTIRIEVEKQKLLSTASKLNMISPLGRGSLLRGAWGNIDKLGYLLLAFKLARNIVKFGRKLSRK